LELLEHSTELLKGNVLGVGWVEILEERFQEDSMSLDQLLDVRDDGSKLSLFIVTELRS